MSEQHQNLSAANAMRRSLPRTPPAPLEGPRIRRHFESMWRSISTKTQLATDLSPTTIGNVRECFVREFLEIHKPSDFSIGTGHVLYPGSEDASPQIDLLVWEKSGFALPLGNVSLVFADGLVACVEVKSTLTRDAFVGQIAKMFRSLPPPNDGKLSPLRVVVAVQLEGSSQNRCLIQKWANEASLPPEELPDLVITLDNAAIIKGGALECLEEPWRGTGGAGKMYKFGSYQDHKWIGLMLLVFELAQRAGGADWRPYIRAAVEGVKSEPL